MRTLNPVVVAVREGSKFQADTAASIVAGLTADNYSSETLCIHPGESQGRSAGNPDSPVDIEITAHPLTASAHPNLVVLGVIIALPLLLVVQAGSTDITSPRDLKGKTIELGLKGTTIASVAEQILANYGVTEANSTFGRDTDVEAFASFASNETDAAFVYFNPELEQIERIAVGGRLRILDLPENIVLAGQIGTVVPAVVPRGAFSIELARPDRDIPTVAVPVTVVANKGIRDGVADAIVQALTAQFSRGTALAPPETLPKFDGALPVYPRHGNTPPPGRFPGSTSPCPGSLPTSGPHCSSWVRSSSSPRSTRCSSPRSTDCIPASCGRTSTRRIVTCSRPHSREGKDSPLGNVPAS